MNGESQQSLELELIERRRKLQSALSHVPAAGQLRSLLDEVDAALGRMSDGTFGLCETCHDPIERDRVLANPLVRFCLDHLTVAGQRALEEDLELAARIQKGLLPPGNRHLGGWQVDYHFEPASLVSGDYCDLIAGDDGGFFFALGDVSGKGVAASMLMSHLHAMFRSLVPMGLQLREVMDRASRVFCESTLPTHYATLVCGRADTSGKVELCNAGHLPALLVGPAGVREIESTGLPVGLFCEGGFDVRSIQVNSGDALVLYSDGITEAEDADGREYGQGRLSGTLAALYAQDVSAMLSAAVRDVDAFRHAAPLRDDRTMMIIRRVVTA